MFKTLITIALIFNLGSIALVAQQPTQTSVFDVRDFGASGDGTNLDTPAIQNAIRAANKAGGGTVILHPGTYVTGTFELLSNVTLDIEAGAVIQGSKNVADYRAIQDFGFGRNYGIDSTGEGFKLGLIVARNADNVSIIGKGAIDGSGDDFFDFTRPHYSMDFDPDSTRQRQGFMDAVLNTGDGPAAVKTSGRAGTMIVFSNCTNVTLRDITLRNAPNWTLHLQNVRDSAIHAIHILNDLRIPNNDGIDCMSCRNVQISDCDIQTGDDDFAIVSSEGITITNCSMVSNSSAIRFEDTRFSVFSNLVIHANRGIAIYERGTGVTSSVLFSNIVIETHLLTGHWWGKGEPIYVAAGTADGKGGTIRDVRFSNISGQAENGIVVYGDPGATIENVAFDQVAFRMRVTRKDINAAVGGNFDLRWTAESVTNGVIQHDIPAFYARYVDGLEIHGLQLSWADAMPSYYSSAVEIEDSRNIRIDRFAGRQASAPSESPVIALGQVHDVSITNSRADHGASTFLSTRDVTGERLFTGNDLLDARQAFGSKTTFTLGQNIMPSKK